MLSEYEKLKDEASGVLRQVFNDNALEYVKYIKAKEKLDGLFDELIEPKQKTINEIMDEVRNSKKIELDHRFGIMSGQYIDLYTLEEILKEYF